MTNDISNKTIAVLIVIALLVLLIGLVTISSKVGDLTRITGFATSDESINNGESQELTKTISVRKGDNSGTCTITMVEGIVTATTC
ncbi:hypothetical protein KY339_02145 [Candidatus Woesearchaeota archaeon]|nr:hypothetical protein [Candidatus Woesearchaeota archaeon]